MLKLNHRGFPKSDVDVTRNLFTPLPTFYIDLLLAMADVEMKPAEEKTKGEKKDEEKKDDKKEEKKDTKPPQSPVAEIKSNIALIERAVTTLEPRFTHRVLRTLTSLRKRIDDKVLRDAIEEVYTKGELFAFENRWRRLIHYCRWTS